MVDYRVEFTKWWVTEFKTVKFPTQGTVFDYYIDPETHKFEPWTKKVAKFELDPEMPLQVNITEAAIYLNFITPAACDSLVSLSITFGDYMNYTTAEPVFFGA